MTLRWSLQARRDLDAIFDYIAEDDPAAALRWVRRLQAKAASAVAAPTAGRVVPEVNRDDVREVFLRSYRIVYRIMKDEIVVLTVFEGRRLFPAGAADSLEGDSLEDDDDEQR
ncbi:MAG: type II toxin-antitoxin system RelE/ParE family toxin [Myxococcales bacterium]|nr:type II toxin-antitoxin system RelE/ParE family toxin [Myxococcales bacterium]